VRTELRHISVSDPLELADTSSTRTFDTLFGELSYQEVSDQIADPLRLLLDNVALGSFDAQPLDVDLIRHFHREILVSVMPDIAGRWRKRAVRVGNHYPPEHCYVDMKMREAFQNYEARIALADGVEHQLEALAYLEAASLNIHPFEDFNGRAVRVVVAEAMRRVDFPVVDLSVDRDTEEHSQYVAALRAYDDHMALKPLCDFWGNIRFRGI